MAGGLAAARGALILSGLVLGLDVGGELVEFLHCAIACRGRGIDDQLGFVDILLDALSVSVEVLVEGGELLRRAELARIFGLDALVGRDDDRTGGGRRRGLSVCLGANGGKRRGEQCGKKQAGDHRGPRRQETKGRILSRDRSRGKYAASSSGECHRV